VGLASVGALTYGERRRTGPNEATGTGGDVHDPNILYAAAVLGYLYGQSEIAARRLRANDQPSAAVATEMAHSMLGEALTRLGVPLPGNAQDMQERPLVLRVQPGVAPDRDLRRHRGLRGVG